MHDILYHRHHLEKVKIRSFDQLSIFTVLVEYSIAVGLFYLFYFIFVLFVGSV